MQKSGSNAAPCAAIVATLVTTLAAPAAHAAWTLNMTQGITDISRKVYGLHMMMLWVCVALATFVFGWMIFSIVRYRKSKGAIPDTKLVHNTKAEIVWTVVPIIILIATAVPAARRLIDLDDASGAELSIKVTAYQWKWGYEYLDSGVQVLSTLDRTSNATRQLDSGLDPNKVENYLLNVDHPLVVPAGTKVRLLITAQDVIHAWWVPALAVKKDAIPGYVNQIWFNVDADKVGTYRGQCAELCGRDHGFMPIVVEVKSKEDFAAWVKTQQSEKAVATAAAAPAAG